MLYYRPRATFPGLDGAQYCVVDLYEVEPAAGLGGDSLLKQIGSALVAVGSSVLPGLVNRPDGGAEWEEGAAYEEAARQVVAEFDRIQLAAKAGQLSEAQAAAQAAQFLDALRSISAQLQGKGAQSKAAEYLSQFDRRLEAIKADARAAFKGVPADVTDATPDNAPPRASLTDHPLFWPALALVGVVVLWKS